MFVRRFSGVVLVVCLLAPMVVGYTWFSWRRSHLQGEMRALILKGIPREKLVHFAFAHQQLPGLLHWEKKDEFRYRGEMYDVVDSESDSDSVHYWCLHDHRESQLKRDFKALLADLLDHEPLTKTARQRLISFLKTDYTPGHSLRVPELNGSLYSLSTYCLISDGVSEQEPFEPPPRIG